MYYYIIVINLSDCNVLDDFGLSRDVLKLTQVQVHRITKKNIIEFKPSWTFHDDTAPHNSNYNMKKKKLFHRNLEVRK